MPIFSEIEELPDSRLSAMMTVEGEELETVKARIFRDFSKSLSLPGFRKGKIPESIARKEISEGELISKAVETLAGQSLSFLVRERAIIPVSEPNVDLSEVKPTKIALRLEVEVLPEVDLKPLEELSIKESSPEPVTDQAVDNLVAVVQKRSATFLDKDSGSVAIEGDRLEISFTGEVDGQPAQDLTSDNHPIILGETPLINDLKLGLLGMKVGEKKEIKVSYPADFHRTRLAGKKAKFLVSLLKIESRNLPEVDDRLAEKLGFQSLLAMRRKFKENLENEQRIIARQKTEAEAIEAILKKIDFPLPTTLIKREIDRLVGRAKSEIEATSGSLLSYLENRQKDLSTFRSELEPVARGNLKLSLIVSRFLKETGKDGRITKDDSQTIFAEALSDMVDRITRNEKSDKLKLEKRDDQTD